MNTNNKLSYKKKALISLIFGITSLLLCLLLFFRLGINFLLIILQGVLGVWGLVLGIKSLKATKNIIAIMGIVLCGIAILLWIYGLLFIYAFLSGNL